MGKNTDKLWDVIVIGAGASGMTSAITAARNGKKVLLLEQLDKAGKKLLATGNGKCNFTNAIMDENCYGGDRLFINSVLNDFSTKDCLEFFHSIGIFPKNKNGYYYPNSEQASSVVNALLGELTRLNVKIIYETKVREIFPKENSVSLYSNKGTFDGRKLIIATGLKASPKLGSDGNLFDTIRNLGHTMEPVLPALCGYYCKGISFAKVSGVRANGKVSAIIENEVVAEDIGEIQFTDYGLSGIPVFQISRHLSKALNKNESVSIRVNLFPDFEEAQLMEELSHRKELFINQTLDMLLNGLVNQKLTNVILAKANLDCNMFTSSLTEDDLQKICKLLQCLQVKVIRARDFEFAQVCTGGIPVIEINWDTLESTKVSNIYFTGELLDVDGICGGYNLHFAWATGIRAGKAV